MPCKEVLVKKVRDDDLRIFLITLRKMDKKPIATELVEGVIIAEFEGKISTIYEAEVSPEFVRSQLQVGAQTFQFAADSRLQSSPVPMVRCPNSAIANARENPTRFQFCERLQ